MAQDQSHLDVTVNADTSAAQTEFRQLTTLADQLGQRLAGAFEKVALRGRRLSDVLRGLSLSLSRMVLQAAFKPLQTGLGNIFSSILTGLGRTAANGVAIQNIALPFAKGGVIASPVGFPLAGRFGEAGADPNPAHRGRRPGEQLAGQHRAKRSHEPRPGSADRRAFRHALCGHGSLGLPAA